MRIVIASGKGGVGKSTLAASLALLFARDYDFQLVDADVDCPDLPLLFEGEDLVREEVRSGKLAKIDFDKCTRCMLCHEKCPFNAIDTNLDVDPYLCEGCGVCSYVCPENAIILEERATGVAVKRRVEYDFAEGVEFPFIFGELFPGSTSSGKLVDALKRLEDKKEITLVDSAAGIGCPVIASVQGADLVIIVTEPTPSAFDDMIRMHKLAEHFNVFQVLVINKSDVSDKWHEKVRSFSDDAGLPILGEIPFHDSVFKALAMSKPVITTDSPVKQNIKHIYDKVKQIIENGFD